VKAVTELVIRGLWSK